MKLVLGFSDEEIENFSAELLSKVIRKPHSERKALEKELTKAVKKIIKDPNPINKGEMKRVLLGSVGQGFLKILGQTIKNPVKAN